MTGERIEDAELNALVDGELDPVRQAEVEAWLAEHPDAGQRVAQLRAQNAGLHALFDPVLDEDIPARIVAAIAGRRSRPAIAFAVAASLAALAVGAAAGWLANDMVRRGDAPAAVATASAPAIDTGELMTRAATAHVVNAPEDNVPPTILAAGEESLASYLSARTGAMVRVPKLSRFGYRLVGGRVLPDTGTAAAQFTFENPDGKRVTLYVRREKANGQDITYALAQDLSMFYWNDSGRSYALVAATDDEVARKDLLQAAEAVYRQLADMPDGG
jgi:anti-sigma factor RsiW